MSYPYWFTREAFYMTPKSLEWFPIFYNYEFNFLTHCKKKKKKKSGSIDGHSFKVKLKGQDYSYEASK